jgi:hypothetical protein
MGVVQVVQPLNDPANARAFARRRLAASATTGGLENRPIRGRGAQGARAGTRLAPVAAASALVRGAIPATSSHRKVHMRTKWTLALGLLPLAAAACDASTDGAGGAAPPSSPDASHGTVDGGGAADDAAVSKDGTTPPAVDASDAALDGAGDGIPDSGDFFGASRCQGGAFLVCDDFEAAALDANRWSYYPGNGPGMATVDATKFARGKQALHMRSPTQITANGKWDFLSAGFYLRAFVFWNQPIGDHHVNYFNAIQPGVGQFSVGSYDGQLAIIEYGPNNGDQGLGAKDDLPTGRWACIEWQVHPSSNEVEVWMDEADVPTKNGYPFPGPTMHVTNWPPMPWTSFSIELNTAHSTDEMWIDELAIDTKRIGCRR